MRILAVLLFHQHFLNSPRISGRHLSSDLLYFPQQPVKPVFYHIFRHLVFHHCGRGPCPLGINKGKGAVIPDLLHHIHSFQKIFLCLSRKSHNDIRSQRNIRHSLPDLSHQIQILLLVIPAVHQLQDPAAA